MSIIPILPFIEIFFHIRSSPRSCLTCYICLFSFLSSGQVPQPLFVFHVTAIFKEYARHFTECPQFGLVYCFLVFRFRLCIWASILPKWHCVLLRVSYPEACKIHQSLLGDINFNHLNKVLFSFLSGVCFYLTIKKMSFLKKTHLDKNKL